MEILQILSLLLTTIATVVLAILTAKYVRLTHLMLEEAKSQKEPNVWVDLEFLPHYDIKLLIGNSGSTPAKDITFQVYDNIPWRKDSGVLQDLSPIKNGISYLAPFRTLKYDAGYFDWIKFKEEKRTIEINLIYKTETGKILRKNFPINLLHYSDILYETFKNPNDEIVEALKSQRNSSDIKNSLKNFIKKSCPFCCESISPNAKKCPHCHEWLKKEGEEPLEKDG